MPVDDRRLTHAVRVLARLTRNVEQACQSGELSLPQYRLLLFVNAQPQRAGELASRASVSRPTLTSLVDGLEKQGLVERGRVSGDRRGITLELTPKGKAALEKTEGQLKERLGFLIEEGDADQLVDGLISVGEVLRHELEARLKRGAAETPEAATDAS
jgi:DNA-binding MarR family transcriptional regulator